MSSFPNFGLTSRPTFRAVRNSAPALYGPLLVAGMYFLGAEAAFSIGTLSDKIFALFWPPNVVLFCALLVVPSEHWWRYILISFPAHAIAELLVGMPVPQLLVAYTTNCMVAVMNAYLVRQWTGGPPWFGTVRAVLNYCVITAGLSPAVSALGGAFVPILGSGSLRDYWIFWSHWYLANALPCLTLGPVFLIWFSGRKPSRSSFAIRRQLEPLIVAATIAGSCVAAAALINHLSSSSYIACVLLMPLPFVLWASVRFGERGASAGILIVTVILTWFILRTPSLFPNESPDRSVLALQLFLMGLSIPILLLGASIDELRGTERTMRDVAGSILHAQDQERRRIARELHDSTGQNLIAGTLIARRIQDALPKSAEPLVQQLDQLLQQSIRELRTLSYLLHPPLLDEAGLGTALRSYIDGYIDRSGISVDLEIQSDFGRLAPDVELVLFRIVQEALTNISRHAYSSTASIRLWRSHKASADIVEMTIDDAGRGMPHADARALGGLRSASIRGLGLVSMRERLNQIGGRLEIESKATGTRVRAIISIVRQ